MTILVTGGAGYIGAHVVRLLLERGDKVVVVDDLSTGETSRIGDATLVELDVAAPGAQETIAAALREHEVDAVIHFAARKQVGESMARPTYYYQQNVTGLANVLGAMEDAGVERLVFSSSAATYGMPSVSVVEEKLHAEPINPYGETKLIGEWMGRAASRAWGLRFVALRYFNVAGSGWDDLGDPAVLNLASSAASSRGSSVTTTRRRTVPASATTSTCSTWPRRTSPPCPTSTPPPGPSTCSTSARAPAPPSARCSTGWPASAA